MARKGGSGGNRRSGGRRSGGASRKGGRSGMQRQMRRGMRAGVKGPQGKTPQVKKGGSNMKNIKLGAALAVTKGFGTGSYHEGEGCFGANEESQVEQEMAYMSVYDQMLEDECDQIHQHLELLSIEG